MYLLETDPGNTSHLPSSDEERGEVIDQWRLWQLPREEHYEAWYRTKKEKLWLESGQDISKAEAPQWTRDPRERIKAARSALGLIVPLPEPEKIPTPKKRKSDVELDKNDASGDSSSSPSALPKNGGKRKAAQAIDSAGTTHDKVFSTQPPATKEAKKTAAKPRVARKNTRSGKAGAREIPVGGISKPQEHLGGAA